MKKKEWIALTVTALTVISLLLPVKPGKAYRTADIQVRTVEETIEALGVVQPMESYAAAPPSSGRLRLLVRKGEQVRAGQALFELENVPEGAAQALQAYMGESGESAPSLADLYKANTVLAPLSGRVQSLRAVNGQTVTLGSPVLVVDSEELALRFTVPQSNREDLRVGQTVRAIRKDREYRGTIEEIALGENGQYEAVASIENASGLESGMQMDVSVLLRSVTAPCVPLEAVKDGDCLDCLTQDGVARVWVETSVCDAMYMALLSGPAPGTKVVLGEVT